jgi:hypothetical protein
MDKIWTELCALFQSGELLFRPGLAGGLTGPSPSGTVIA